MARIRSRTVRRSMAGLFTIVFALGGAAVLVRTSGDTIPKPPAPPPAPPADSAAPADPVAPAAPPLQAVLERFVAAQPVPFSVVAVGPSSVQAGHLADRQVLSASLYKLFVAAELLRQVHDGALSRDSVAGDGSGRTVGACIRDMIVVSDNRCGAWGLRHVGSGRMDPGLVRQGFSGTSLASPQRTTAADVARSFERARNGTLLGPGREAATGELYGLLRAQQVNDRLPLGLPPGTPMAHKTGDRLHWAHDAGIITTPGGELLLVALTGPWPSPCCDADRPGPAEARAFGAIADLARNMYGAISSGG